MTSFEGVGAHTMWELPAYARLIERLTSFARVLGLHAGECELSPALLLRADRVLE